MSVTFRSITASRLARVFGSQFFQTCFAPGVAARLLSTTCRLIPRIAYSKQVPRTLRNYRPTQRRIVYSTGFALAVAPAHMIATDLQNPAKSTEGDTSATKSKILGHASSLRYEPSHF